MSSSGNDTDLTAATSASIGIDMDDAGRIHKQISTVSSVPGADGGADVFQDEDDAAKALADRVAQELPAVVAELHAAGSQRLFELVFAQMSSYARMDVFRVLPLDSRKLSFCFLRPSEASIILDECAVDDAEAYIASLPADTRLDSLQSYSYGAVQRVMHVLKADEKAACDFVRLFPVSSVGRAMHRVPLGMTVLGSQTLDKAVAALASTAAAATDPRRGGGIILVRSADNKLLGWTDFPTLLKLSRGAALDSVRYYGTAEEGHTHAHGHGHAGTHPAGSPPRSPARPEPTASVAEPTSPVVQSTAAGLGLSEDASTTTVESVMYPMVHVLKTEDDAEELVRQYSVADYSCIPVVDKAGVLVGVVRARDAIKALNERVVALTTSDTGITSYSKSSAALLVRKRIVWLLILAALNFGVAAVVGQFEEILSQNLVLAGFIPLLAGMGGNIGAQTTGLVISAVSSRDIARNDVWRVLRKEVVVGFWLAVILGLVASVMGYIRAGEGSKGLIALTIGSSMAVVAAIANLLGVFMPFGSLATGQDPAVSSSPLITTAIDVIGISLYLALAQIILKVKAEPSV